MFSFMKSFLGVKGKQFGADVIEAIVGIDPEGATQAQMAQMEKDLDNTGMMLQKIRADYEREVREAEEAMQRYDKMMAAAELLQARLADPAMLVTEHAAIEASLARLIGQIEGFAHEVEQEKQDMIEVKALLDEAQTAYKAKAEALTQARQGLDRARRDMQRATLQAERAEEKAKRAAEVACLRGTTTNRLSIATDAMQRKAEEARAKAAALNLKADALALAKPGASDDPLITEAMRAIESKPGANNANLAERLAALLQDKK
ncbi:MAG: hypothetical protein FD153_1921 [Rhodospirillaceae bacterium]|nr:MAG: hypothetical protein FD153_1921 [Rhodospirillaceae bacterium]